MGSRVGALLIDMAMNTAAFASDLSKSNASLTSWATSTNKTLAGVVNGYRSVSKELKDLTLGSFTLRNALLGLVGGGAFGLFIKNQLEAASAIVDTADNIGVSTKALQEYTYAARLSGVNTEQLQGAMKQFATSVGQAHVGAGKLYSYLKEANPTLLQQIQSSKSVDEALNATFVTMGKLSSQTDRLALTSAAFGKKNLEMVNLVKDGVPAFEAMRQKANDLGIVIRDDLLRNAEDAGDKVDTLSQVFRAQLVTAVAANAKEIGHFAEVLAEAIPGMVDMATKAVELISIFVNWRKTILELEAAYIGLSTKTVVGLLKMKDATTLGLTSAGEDAKRVQDMSDEALLKIRDQIDAIGKGQQASSNAANDNAKSTKAAKDAVEGYAEAQRKAALASQQAAEDFKKLKAAADKIKQDGQGAFVNYLNDIAQLDKMLKANLITWEQYGNAVRQAQEKNFHTTERVKKVLGDTETAQEKYNAQVKELNELRGVQGGLSEEQYQQALAKTNAELRKAQLEGTLFGSVMDKAIDGNINSWNDLGMAVVDYGKQVLKALIAGQNFQQALGGGGSFGGLGAILGGVGSFFGIGTAGTTSAIQASIAANPGIFHSGGIVGRSGGARRNVNPGIFANAPRFHGGGLVGGEVPIIAKKGERVLTEQQQREMNNGGTVVYQIDARGAAAGVEQQLRQMIMELHQSVEPRAIKAVQNQRLRDPRLFGGAR